MTDVQPRLTRARQFVEEYAESWRRDHREAMECSEFEADLAEGVAVFRLLESVRLLLERFVVHTGAPELWEKFKALHTKLVGSADARLQTLSQFERQFGTVANAPEFRECVRKAQATVAAWPSVPVPKAVGSRSIDLSEDEAEELHALKDAPPEAPGKLKIEPNAVPLAADSILR